MPSSKDIADIYRHYIHLFLNRNEIIIMEGMLSTFQESKVEPENLIKTLNLSVNTREGDIRKEVSSALESLVNAKILCSSKGNDKKTKTYFIDDKVALDSINYRLELLWQKYSSRGSKDNDDQYVCTNPKCGERYPSTDIPSLLNAQTNKVQCRKCKSPILQAEKPVINTDQNDRLRMAIEPLIQKVKKIQGQEVKKYLFHYKFCFMICYGFDVLCSPTNFHNFELKGSAEGRKSGHGGGGRSLGGHDYSDDLGQVKVVFDGVHDRLHIPNVTRPRIVVEKAKKVMRTETPPWIQSKHQRLVNPTTHNPLNNDTNVLQGDPNIEIDAFNKEALHRYLNTFYNELSAQIFQRRNENGEEMDVDGDSMDIEEDNMSDFQIPFDSKLISIFDVTDDILEKMTEDEYRIYCEKITNSNLFGVQQNTFYGL